MRIRAAIALSAFAVAACEAAGDGGNQPPAEGHPAITGQPLDPRAKLSRVSVALRGVRPSAEDLARVERDASELPRLVDEYLASRGFGDAVRDLFDEALNVQVAAAIFPAGFITIGGLAGEDAQRANVSITEAPLRLIEHLVRNDRPLTEIVTADYTLADGTVAAVWGLPYTGTGQSWEVTRYEDGRPHAGVLSDSWLYTRHSTTFSNKNRGRANAIARGLLCYDFLDRKIEIDSTINLADPAEVANAIQKNPTCASCHQTLDPLAAHFGVFHSLYVPQQLEAYPVPFYQPALTSVFTVRPPGYFGFQGGDARDLGRQIAEDPRFSLCMARRFYSYFHQIPLDEVPQERAAELQRVALEQGTGKALARAVVLGDDFLSFTEERGFLKVRPWQLASSIEDLTGFHWETRLDVDVGSGNLGTIDLMKDSLFGFSVLAGGIDSINVTLPAHTMTASASLVLRALGERAADHVVEGDFRWPASAKLLTGAASGDTGEAAVRAELAALSLRLFGERSSATSEEVSLAWELFRNALSHGGGDAKRAWKTTLLALFEDPRLQYY